ncbi:MAG: hypothetical protein P9M09_00985, partial [Candidatus Celaenobacter antarcticus]|nr:hypothetical protein [Candidatus Celaenobacter antarcticus]
QKEQIRNLLRPIINSKGTKLTENFSKRGDMFYIILKPVKHLLGILYLRGEKFKKTFIHFYLKDSTFLFL